MVIMMNYLFVIMSILFIFVLKGYFYGISTVAINDYTEKNIGNEWNGIFFIDTKPVNTCR